MQVRLWKWDTLDVGTAALVLEQIANPTFNFALQTSLGGQWRWKVEERTQLLARETQAEPWRCWGVQSIYPIWESNSLCPMLVFWSNDKSKYSSHISSFDSKVVYNNCSCSLDAGFTTSAQHNISESCFASLAFIRDQWTNGLKTP